MTPDELAEKIDKSLDHAFSVCSNAKEYTDLLKVAIEYYAKRRENADGAYGKALTRGSQNGG